MVPKELLSRGHSNKGARACSRVFWLCTVVQISSAFSPAPEVAAGGRPAMCKWKGKSSSAPCLPHTWRCSPQLRPAALSSLQAEEQMFTGQASVSSRGRASSVKKASLTSCQLDPRGNGNLATGPLHRCKSDLLY